MSEILKSAQREGQQILTEHLRPSRAHGVHIGPCLHNEPPCRCGNGLGMVGTLRLEAWSRPGAEKTG